VALRIWEKQLAAFDHWHVMAYRCDGALQGPPPAAVQMHGIRGG